MEKNRKQALINYLYPRKEIAEFLFDDLYVELTTIIPKKICFSTDNIKFAIRKNNYEKVRELINNFIENNVVYKNKLIDLYNDNNLNDIIKDIIIGYVFYITPHINKNTGADVFLDRRSVCFTNTPFIYEFYQ